MKYPAVIEHKFPETTISLPSMRCSSSSFPISDPWRLHEHKHNITDIQAPWEASKSYLWYEIKIIPYIAPKLSKQTLTTLSKLEKHKQ